MGDGVAQSSGLFGLTAPPGPQSRPVAVAET